MALQNEGKSYGGGKPKYDKPAPVFNGQFNPQWITNGVTRETVDFSDGLGKFLQQTNLAPSQLRNVFGEIKRIQMKGFKQEETSFHLLKPKMAYAAKRQTKSAGINELKKAFDMAHDQVFDEKTYKNFVDFFESILAYHKAYSDKD